MGGTCGVAREGEGGHPTRCQFLLCLFTRESPFGGVCIHMQYIIHGLYFMKRNNENDRFLFPWCLRPCDLCPCVPASLRPCVPASLRPCVPASLRPCVPASLRPCVPASCVPCARRCASADAGHKLQLMVSMQCILLPFLSHILLRLTYSSSGTAMMITNDSRHWCCLIMEYLCVDIDCPCSAMLQVCPSPPFLVVGGGIRMPLPRVCGDLLFTTHVLNTTYPHAYVY